MYDFEFSRETEERSSQTIEKELAVAEPIRLLAGLISSGILSEEEALKAFEAGDFPEVWEV